MPVKNPRQILVDLKKELGGELLSDEFTIGEHKFQMTLLNEEETNWTYQQISISNPVGMAMALKLPTLAISIRYIDGTSVSELYASEWEAETVDMTKALIDKTAYTRKFFEAEHLLNYLKDFPTEFISKLWEHYQSLKQRHEDSQGQLKNLSREDSEKAAKTNTTESSLPGEELPNG